MNILKYIIFFIAIITFSSCNNNSTLKKRIKKYEKNNFNTNVLHISLMPPKKTFCFADSAIILEKELEIFIKEKNKKFNSELEKIDLRISKLLKNKDLSKNDNLSNIIENRIFFLRNKKNELLEIIDIYNNNPEQTQIQKYRTQIKYYKALPDSIIGYKINARFNAKTGDMPKQLITKKYLFSADLQKVIGVLKHYN